MDHNAATPMRSQIHTNKSKEIIYGNPSSLHRYGQRQKATLEDARENIAQICNWASDNIVFTSGATESNHIMIKSLLSQCSVIYIDSTAHSSVTETIKMFADTEGAVQLVWIRPCSYSGQIEIPENIATKQEISAGLILSWVNHETGVIQSYDTLVKWKKFLKDYYYTGFIGVDATQGAGRLLLNSITSLIDYCTFSSHKLGGPIGVGCLLWRQSSVHKLPIWLYGGGQEKGYRSGTSPVCLIEGMSTALTYAQSEENFQQVQYRAKLHRLNEQKLLYPAIVLFAHATRVDVSCIAYDEIPKIDQVILMDCAGYAISAGSACFSGSSMSSVLDHCQEAEKTHAPYAIRISSGWPTTEQEINDVFEKWGKICTGYNI